MQRLRSLTLALAMAAMCDAQMAGAQSVATPGAAAPSVTASEAFRTGPPMKGGPVVVRADFHLHDVTDVDDEEETFAFVGVLALRWHDERQAFDPGVVGVEEKVFQGSYQFNEVFDGWFPQVVLVNAVGAYEKRGVVLRVRSDGSLTMLETVDAAAETDLDLRRYPLDRQQLDAMFEVLGFDDTEVVLQVGADTSSTNDDQAIRVPQWNLAGISASVRDRPSSYAGPGRVASTFIVSMDVRRRPFFTVRLVGLPLGLIVMLSWSVFWMERSSLGDRINVSFIGILTAVAYQIVVSDILPDISYFTLMNGFLNLSFLMMCATVPINLVVGALDKQGRFEVGDRVDRRCRWIFPLTYFGLSLLMLGVAFVWQASL